MPYDAGLLAPSPFLTGLGTMPRPKSFAEDTLDQLTSMSPKQLIGLPLTAPLTALGGAIRGGTFGLLDPTDEIVDGLGEFAPPPVLKSGLEIAGEVGGSLIPYVGASKVAGLAFSGMNLTSKLLRGATTFGAPEVLRQAFQGELSPTAAVRSLATGAAFALPVSRAVLAPAVFATNLATGGSLVEAGTAAGFAALFGPLEGLPARAAAPKPAGDGTPPPTNLLPDIDLSDFVALRKLKAEGAQPAAVPTGQPSMAGVSQARAADAVKRGFLRPKSQSELIRAAADTVGGATGQVYYHGGPPGLTKFAESPSSVTGNPTAQFGTFLTPERHEAERIADVFHKGQGTVYEVAADLKKPFNISFKDFDRFTKLDLSGDIAKQESTNFEKVRRFKRRLVQAGYDGMIVGVPGKSRPQEVIVFDPARAQIRQNAAGEALHTLASTVELLAKNSPETLAAGLTKAIDAHGATSQQAKTVQLALAEAKGAYVPAGAPVTNSLGTAPKGIDIIATDPTSPFVNRALQSKIITQMRESNDPLAITQAAKLERLWLEARSKRKNGAVTMQDAQELLKRQEEILNSGRVKFSNDDEAFATMQQEVAAFATPRELSAFEAAIPEHYTNRSPQFTDRVRRHIAEQRRIAQRIEAEKLPISPDELESGLLAGDHGAAMHPLSDGWALATGGQDIGRRFRDVGDVRKYLTDLEAGTVNPTNIQELRLLGHPRGIAVDYDGSGVQLINQVSGETVTGLTTLEEALALLRQAPRLVDDAVDLTPPSLGRNPGPGHLGGVATEAAPDACYGLTDAVFDTRY